MSIITYYLPLRARAEITRLLLAYSGVQHENVSLSFADFMSAKSSGDDIVPFGQLPSMRLPSGTIIAESGAMARYVARLANLYPEDLEEIAKAEMLFELTQDMNAINPILNWFEYNSEAWQGAYDSYFSNFPVWVAAAQKLLGDKQYFGGDKPHFGDIAFLHICLNTLEVSPDALAQFPTVLDWVHRLKSTPSISEYLEGRPGPSTPGWGKPNSFIMSKK